MTRKKFACLSSELPGRLGAISSLILLLLTVSFTGLPLQAGYAATTDSSTTPAAAPVAAPEAPSTPAKQPETAVPVKDTGKCFLWKATGNESTGTVYLLGSLHMVPREMYPLPKEVEQAFAGSKALYLEIDESKTDKLAMQQMTMSKGMYLNGETLADHVSKETREMLDKYTANLGQMSLAFKVMKPWLAAMTIEVFELQRLGFDPSLGLDRHFLTKALEERKDVGELESMQQQLDLLSGFSPELQEKFLHYTLADLKNIEGESKQMVQAWRSGDPIAMDDLMSKTAREEPACLPIVEKILYERNVTMADKIADLLKNKSTTYVVVGAAHLTGDKGVIKLLSNKGFKVEQVERSERKLETSTGITTH